MRNRYELAERVFYAGLGAAVGLPGLLALRQGQWGLALAALAAGGVWAVAHWRGWRWLSPVAFAALVALAAGGLWVSLPAGGLWVSLPAGGLWVSLPAGGLVAGAAAALGAWDLDGFAHRLAQFRPRPEYARLVRNHVGRLLLILAAGVALGEAALWLRFTLGFGLVVGLGVLAFLILTRAARLLEGESERGAQSPPPTE